MNNHSFLLTPLVLVVSCATPDTSWPTHGFPHSTPAEEGVDAATLSSIDAEIRSGRYGSVDSMLVIRNGRVIADHHYERDYVRAAAERDQTPHQYNYDHPDWHPFFHGTRLHTLQSVTKSVTSVLLGIAIQRGSVGGTDVSVTSFFSDRVFPDVDGKKAAMTLDDVLTMRAGFEWDEWTGGYGNPENDCIQLEAQEDWIQFVLDKPMATEPGTTFVYNSGATHLLSGIIQRATGDTIDRFAERELFGPLGIENYHWKKTPSGLPDTEGGLYLEPADLAKIGFLFLNDGVWEDRRLLPEGWVDRSTTAWVADIAPDNPNFDRGYGYKWWICDDGTGERPKLYAALGYGGQLLLVAPEHELIGVFTAWNIHADVPPLLEVFRDRVIGASELGTMSE